MKGVEVAIPAVEPVAVLAVAFSVIAFVVCSHEFTIATTCSNVNQAACLTLNESIRWKLQCNGRHLSMPFFVGSLDPAAAAELQTIRWKFTR